MKNGALALWTVLGVFVVSAFGDVAHAATFDQLIGIRLSEYVSQTVFAAPPMPSLIDKAAGHFTTSGSYLKAGASNSLEGGGSYSGSFKGGTAGIGFSRNFNPDLSLFMFGMVSHLSGSIDANFPNSPSESLSGMSSTGSNFAGGLSVRLWSSKSFPLSIGLLAGPFISYYSGGFTLSPYNYDYSANTLLYGAFGGVQANLGSKNFGLNPYVLYYDDLAAKCQPYNTDNPLDTGNSTDSCSQGGAVRKLTLKGSFLALGVNVRLFGLAFHAWDKIENDSSFSEFSSTNYALSYTFDF